MITATSKWKTPILSLPGMKGNILKPRGAKNFDSVTEQKLVNAGYAVYVEADSSEVQSEVSRQETEEKPEKQEKPAQRSKRGKKPSLVEESLEEYEEGEPPGVE